MDNGKRAFVMDMFGKVSECEIVEKRKRYVVAKLPNGDSMALYMSEYGKGDSWWRWAYTREELKK